MDKIHYSPKIYVYVGIIINQKYTCGTSKERNSKAENIYESNGVGKLKTSMSKMELENNSIHNNGITGNCLIVQQWSFKTA